MLPINAPLPPGASIDAGLVGAPPAGRGA
jgi:hypothetical protein